MQINIFTVLLALAFIISISLTVYIVVRRSDKLKNELFLVLLSISIWTFASTAEGMATDLGIKIIFTKLSYIGVVTVPVLFFFFVLRYTNLDKWVTSKRKLFFFIIPVIILFFASTNELHGLVWPDIYLRQNNLAGIFAFYEHGPLYWINIFHSYLFLGVSTFLLVFFIFRYKRLYSLQTRVMVLAALSPFIGNIIYSFSQTSLQGLDITPICFAITGLFLTLAITRYQVLDINPVSKEDITENLYDGVLISNSKNILIDINKAACELLQVDSSEIGKPLSIVLEGKKEIIKHLDFKDPETKKVSEVIIDEGRLFLELRITKLSDRYGYDIGLVIVLRDITAIKEAERKMKETQNLLSNIIDFLPDATFAIDMEGRVIAWNNAIEKLTGIKKKEVIGKGDYIYSLPIYGERRPALVDMLISQDGDLEKNYDFIERHGDNLSTEIVIPFGEKKINLWLSASPLYNSKNEIIGAIESARNITDIKNIEQKLRYISFHDNLTGLYNRAYFEEELKRLNKTRQLPLSIIMADINGLKLVNDAFGHHMGDSLLKHSTNIIKNSCRSEDIVARWGGDEFIILLPYTGSKEAREVIDRISENCSKARFRIPISLSMGYSVKTDETTNIKAVIKKAEDHMYKNKLLSSKSVQDSIIESLTKTLYEKSIETEYHAERVVDISRQLGKRLGLSESKMGELILHAKLHDIGKVAISEKLLKKESKLKKSELEEIKKHSEIGFRIANSSSALAPIAEYILCQHEHWDGRGYPRGLKGATIPLISRIVALADAYDAMTSDRPYRKALSKEKAIKEIRENSGSQFDPDITKAFLEFIEDPEIKF